jgi:serine/threonine protein kinase
MKRIHLLDERGEEVVFPWIVPIFDFWADEVFGSGIYICMIMELVSGPSLEAYIERLVHPRMKCRSTGGFSRVRPGEELSDDDENVLQIHPEMVYRWISQIILGLSVIHKLKVVHRDIKPANLILSVDLKSIKLADFSVSRVFEPNETSLDTSAGTVQYSSPELLQGKAYNEATDMFSLGCVLYEILTLEKVFKVANTAKILSMVARGEVPSVPDDNEPGLVMICNRLMSTDPTRRPSSRILCDHPRLKPYVTTEMGNINCIEIRRAIINFLNFT